LNNIRVFDYDNKQHDVSVLNISETGVKVKFDTAPHLSSNKVFVYGQEVDDFHALNKDYLFTINFAATQELDRIVQAQASTISAYGTTIESQASTISAHSSMIDQQQSTIASYGSILSTLMARL
jgi:hypothetical protein